MSVMMKHVILPFQGVKTEIQFDYWINLHSVLFHVTVTPAQI